MEQKRLRDEIREKLPIKAEKAKTSKVASIHLFCLECMGASSSDAANCEERSCFLWPHGPAGRKEKRSK